MLYLDADQAQSYLNVMKNQKYSTGFHSEVVSLISSYVEDLVGSVKTLDLIDLGPGYPDKAIPIAQHCKAHKIKMSYFPVDVSLPFLKLASKEIRKFTPFIFPAHVQFEDLKPSDINRLAKNSSIIMIGLTFMNFSPHAILPILRAVGGAKTKVLLATEILTKQNDIAQVLSRYELEEARKVAFGPLKILGVRADDVFYNVKFVNGRVEMSFVLKATLNVGGEAIIPAGGEVITAISYRYTREQLRAILKKHFAKVKFISEVNGTTVVAVLE